MKRWGGEGSTSLDDPVTKTNALNVFRVQLTAESYQ